MKPGHIIVGIGTTWCPDTPENRAHFNRLKSLLLNPAPDKTKTPWLGAQIAKENKSLRKLRAFLPGHEPDRRP